MKRRGELCMPFKDKTKFNDYLRDYMRKRRDQDLSPEEHDYLNWLSQREATSSSTDREREKVASVKPEDQAQNRTRLLNPDLSPPLDPSLRERELAQIRRQTEREGFVKPSVKPGSLTFHNEKIRELQHSHEITHKMLKKYFPWINQGLTLLSLSVSTAGGHIIAIGRWGYYTTFSFRRQNRRESGALWDRMMLDLSSLEKLIMQNLDEEGMVFASYDSLVEFLHEQGITEKDVMFPLEPQEPKEDEVFNDGD